MLKEPNSQSRLKPGCKNDKWKEMQTQLQCNRWQGLTEIKLEHFFSNFTNINICLHVFIWIKTIQANTHNICFIEIRRKNSLNDSPNKHVLSNVLRLNVYIREHSAFKRPCLTVVVFSVVRHFVRLPFYHLCLRQAYRYPMGKESKRNERCLGKSKASTIDHHLMIKTEDDTRLKKPLKEFTKK